MKNIVITLCLVLCSLSAGATENMEEFVENVASTYWVKFNRAVKTASNEVERRKDDDLFVKEVIKLEKSYNKREELINSMPYSKENYNCMMDYPANLLRMLTSEQLQPYEIANKDSVFSYMALFYMLDASRTLHGSTVEYFKDNVEDNIVKINENDMLKSFKMSTNESYSAYTKQYLKEMHWILPALLNTANQTYSNRDKIIASFNNRFVADVSTKNCTRHTATIPIAFHRFKNGAPLLFTLNDFSHVNILFLKTIKDKSKFVNNSLSEEMVDLTIDQIAKENSIVPNTRELINLGLAMSYAISLGQEYTYPNSTLYKLAKVQYQKYSITE